MQMRVLRLCPQLVLHFLQLVLSSVQIQDFTFFPNVLIVVTVHFPVSCLSNKTSLVKCKVGCASVSPFQWHLILLHVIFRNWGS